MKPNSLPIYDSSDNPTGCCPRFKPEGWDEQDLHFRDKPFVRVTTRSVFHIPVNMGRVFTRTFKTIDEAGARDDEQFIVLTREVSPWKSEHFFSVTGEVPGEEMVYLNGNYRTHVYEGPYKNAPEWYRDMENRMQRAGDDPEKIYFFYTTCPKCAKYYGKNYVVAVGKAA